MKVSADSTTGKKRKGHNKKGGFARDIERGGTVYEHPDLDETFLQLHNPKKDSLGDLLGYELDTLVYEAQ